MKATAVDQAADILWSNWQASSRIDALPERCRPLTRAEGYAIQAAIVGRSGAAPVGWKIAATSPAGQRHIGVDGPLAGRLLSTRVLESGSQVSLTGNCMQVAEAEFAFRMARALVPRPTPYTMSEVMEAVESLHPAIEIPDSRYHDFVKVGAAQLIADNACACWFVLGPRAPDSWRDVNLATHRVTLLSNGKLVCEGNGANVLGDPRIALQWIANELSRHGEPLGPGQIVTTGTCIVPASIAAGNVLVADFGALGQVGARIA